VLYIYNEPSLWSNGGPGGLLVNGIWIERTSGDCAALRLPVGQIYINGYGGEKQCFTIEAQPGKAYYIRKNVFSVELVDEKTGSAEVARFKSKLEYLPK
jgi:hypothetical protein